jgi:hypothetical protein
LLFRCISRLITEGYLSIDAAIIIILVHLPKAVYDFFRSEGDTLIYNLFVSVVLFIIDSSYDFVFGNYKVIKRIESRIEFLDRFLKNMSIKKWHILFCDSAIKECPVSDFIETLKPDFQMKVLRFLSLLEEMGPTLPRPYADILRDGIHELRIKLGGEQIRMLYFFCYESFIVLYQVLRKHTDRVPDKAIVDTVRYREDLLKRMDKRNMEGHLNASV